MRRRVSIARHRRPTLGTFHRRAWRAAFLYLDVTAPRADTDAPETAPANAGHSEAKVARSDHRSGDVALAHPGALSFACAGQTRHDTPVNTAMRHQRLKCKDGATNGESLTASPIPLRQNGLWHSQSSHAMGQSPARVAFTRRCPGG